MQRSMNLLIGAVLVALAGASLWTPSGWAQSKQKEAASNVSSAPKPPATHGPKQSVIWVIELNDREIAALDQVYEKYASIRLAREAEMGPLHDALEKEEAEKPLDELKLANLNRKIRNAESSIASAFVLAHATAFRQLAAEHSEHLRTLPSDAGAFLNDRYWQLLIMKPEDLWKNPIDDKAAGLMLEPMSFKSVSPVRYGFYSAPGAGFRSYNYGYYGVRPFFRPGFAHVWVFGRYFGHYWQ